MRLVVFATIEAREALVDIDITIWRERGNPRYLIFTWTLYHWPLCSVRFCFLSTRSVRSYKGVM